MAPINLWEPCYSATFPGDPQTYLLDVVVIFVTLVVICVTVVVICVVRLLFVLCCVLFVCKCVLPPGDNPIAVNKYIVYRIVHVLRVLC